MVICDSGHRKRIHPLLLRLKAYTILRDLALVNSLTALLPLSPSFLALGTSVLVLQQTMIPLPKVFALVAPSSWCSGTFPTSFKFAQMKSLQTMLFNTSTCSALHHPLLILVILICFFLFRNTHLLFTCRGICLFIIYLLFSSLARIQDSQGQSWLPVLFSTVSQAPRIGPDTCRHSINMCGKHE